MHKGGIFIRYTTDDFMADLNFSSGRHDMTQKKEEYLNIGIISGMEIEYQEYEDEILRLNTVLRVDHHMRTPYTIHMSYPTARSLYTIRLYIISQGLLLSKDFFGENIVFKMNSEIWKEIGARDGDIVIQALPFTDSHYPSIYKTLQNLEIGHLLYNIGVVAKIYESRYSVDNAYPGFVLLRQEKKEKKHLCDKREWETFWRKAELRSSGKYYGGLINFDADHENYRYIPRKSERIDSVLFHDIPPEAVETLVLLNNGEAYVNQQQGLVCSYQQLTKEYSYVNFRTQSQIYLILCKSPAGISENYADTVQYMGMLAQEVCIENAHPMVYNRPIKQVKQSFWKPVLQQTTVFDGYIPFYGVITGKDSVEYPLYKKIV